jgi:hypothetical protein
MPSKSLFCRRKIHSRRQGVQGDGVQHVTHRGAGIGQDGDLLVAIGLRACEDLG